MASILVNIFLDGQPFRDRNWSHVPRIGDMLTFDNGKIKVKVIAIIWADMGQEAPQGVSIDCKSFTID
ncbi:hypothetical protein [Herbaspirillum sp. RV1423]|uniref:hypothetical protein n=1 Tax=Herbaspirillum sp. RV1423 TaxID=1443993 RepID=UPI00054F2900|nr:hypothetical protein [Herbaspirillum sp. RV1423]